ncbi:MAG: hypothetical protein JSW58_07565 [Candidatus Latescibacterota bacterium]|nr:MAG: hypothetical protein JSW58_07565 [Candidatus Latescibacterota bacterium]
MGKYTITESDINKNKDDILGILKRNLPQQSEEIFDWKYKNCPYGKAVCLLAKDEESNSYVGSGSLFLRKVCIGGESVCASVAGDFAIDKKHRAYGPALKLQKTIQSHLEGNEVKFIYGLPNKLSEAVFLRIGYTEVGRIERYAKVLRSEYKIRGYIRFSLAARIVSKVLDYLIEKFSKETKHKDSSSFGIETPDSFDNRFDALWKKAAGQFEIVGERTSEFLNWRYIQCPPHRYHIFSLVDTKKEIAGYVVYFTENNIYYVVDMLFAHSNVLDTLLHKFIRYSRNQGIFSISVFFMGSDSTVEKLKEWGFRLRESGSRVLLYCDRKLPFSDSLFDKNKWHLLEGDNDI